MKYMPCEHILPGMAKLQLWGYRCERCGHEWVPRNKDEEPRVCPKCKSPYWNRPRKDTRKGPEETRTAEKADAGDKGPAGGRPKRRAEGSVQTPLSASKIHG